MELGKGHASTFASLPQDRASHRQPPGSLSPLTVVERVLLLLLLSCCEHKQTWSGGSWRHALAPSSLLWPCSFQSPLRLPPEDAGRGQTCPQMRLNLKAKGRQVLQGLARSLPTAQVH